MRESLSMPPQFCPQKPAQSALLIPCSIALFLAGWLSLGRALGHRPETLAAPTGSAFWRRLFLRGWQSPACRDPCQTNPKTGHSPFWAGL